MPKSETNSSIEKGRSTNEEEAGQSPVILIPCLWIYVCSEL